MNKTELIANVAEMSEITKKDAEKVVKAMFECISETLAKGEKVQIANVKLVKVTTRLTRNRKLKFRLPRARLSKLVNSSKNALT